MRSVKIRGSTTENERKGAIAMSTRQSRIEKPTTSSSCPVSVTLSVADIPGADLSEPLESHAVASLRWWLLFQEEQCLEGPLPSVAVMHLHHCSH